MKLARKISTILCLVVVANCMRAQTTPKAAAMAQAWVASWGASQQMPEPHNAIAADDLRDATVRQIFHLSVGGPALRVHLSNAFGTEALHFTSVHIARPVSTASSAIDATSDRALTFDGKSEISVPPGAEFISDPLEYSVAPLSDVAVTFHLDSPPAGETGHPGSRATSYYVHGDFVNAANFTEPQHVDHWYQVSEIDVASTPQARAVVALGDSITDGHGATTNGNDRWTDVLARRLQGSPNTRQHWGVEPGDRRQSPADRWFGAECAGAFRSRCAGADECAMGDCVRGSERSGRTGSRWRSVSGGTCGAGAASDRGVSAGHCTRACPRLAGLWSDDHAVMSGQTTIIPDR